MQSDHVNVAPCFPVKLFEPKRSHQEGHTASQDASLRSRSSKSSSHDQLLPQSARHFLAEDSNHAAALAGLDAKAPRQEANVVESLQQAGKCSKPASRAKSCTVCAKGSSFAKLWSCGSCDKLLHDHERCSAELPEPLCHYCLFCPDCKREPWHRGAIILACGSAGVEGKTVDRLKVAVEKIRQAHVDKRAQAGIPGPKTYAGLRGDVVSFRDLFTKMTSPGNHYGFQLEPTPDSPTLSRSQTRWRLDIGWGQPINLLCQKTSVDQVHVADAPVKHAESSGAAIDVDHPDSSLDAQTSAIETICNQPAAAASVVAASGVAKQSSHDSQVSTCKPSPCSTSLPLQSGRGHMRGRPNSSQRGPLGLGSATPLEDRAILGMLKRKAKAAPLQSSSIKKLKRCHDVIDLTSDSDTPVSAQPSEVFRNASFQVNWRETDTSGTKQDEAVTDIAVQHDFHDDDDAGTDKEENMSLQHLAELTTDREAMRKCMWGQLQRLKQHDSRLAPLFCARLSDVVADGGSADDLIARMYSGFQQIRPYQSELSEAEQVNDVGNYFRAFLELEPVFVLEG